MIQLLIVANVDAVIELVCGIQQPATISCGLSSIGGFLLCFVASSFTTLVFHRCWISIQCCCLLLLLAIFGVANFFVASATT